MRLVRAGDHFGLVAHLAHFYSILKLLLVLLATFFILVVKIALYVASPIASRERGYLYCKSGCVAICIMLRVTVLI